MTVSNCKDKVNFLEHAILYVSFDFQPIERGRITINLISSAGTAVNILPGRKFDLDETKLQWSFMTLHQWEENPSGDWKVVFNITGQKEPGNALNILSLQSHILLQQLRKVRYF